MEDLKSILPATDNIVALIMTYGGRLILAIITLILGLWLIRKLTRIMQRAFELRAFEKL